MKAGEIEVAALLTTVVPSVTSYEYEATSYLSFCTKSAGQLVRLTPPLLTSITGAVGRYLMNAGPASPWYSATKHVRLGLYAPKLASIRVKGYLQLPLSGTKKGRCT